MDQRAYFLRMLRKALSFELSSGILSETEVGTDSTVALDLIEVAVDGAGEWRAVTGAEAGAGLPSMAAKLLADHEAEKSGGAREEVNGSCTAVGTADRNDCVTIAGQRMRSKLPACMTLAVALSV